MTDNHSQQASSGSRFITPDEPTGTARTLLEFFIDTYDGITEQRLQKLAFYSEYAYYQEHEERLTSLDYTPSYYGMYSPDLHNMLDRLECETTTKSHPERRRTIDVYLRVTDTTTSSSATPFLAKIHDETHDVSTEHLITFTKNVPLYEQTPDDYIAEFNSNTVEPIDHPQ